MLSVKSVRRLQTMPDNYVRFCKVQVKDINCWVMAGLQKWLYIS